MRHGLIPLLALSLLPATIVLSQSDIKTVTGQAAFADWNQQEPGVRKKITVADLPAPNPAEAVSNTAHVMRAPVRRMAYRSFRLQGHTLCRRRCQADAARR